MCAQILWVSHSNSAQWRRFVSFLCLISMGIQMAKAGIICVIFIHVSGTWNGMPWRPDLNRVVDWNACTWLPMWLGLHIAWWLGFKIECPELKNSNITKQKLHDLLCPSLVYYIAPFLLYSTVGIGEFF